MRAIDQVIDALHSTLPGVLVEQVLVKFPGDDDGLWFVTHPDSEVEVNLESSTGEFPFLIENSGNNQRLTTKTLEETIAAVAAALGLASALAPGAQAVIFDSGNVRAWIEQEAIHLIARDRPSNDPVELTAAEARRLGQALLNMAGHVQS